jgi:hypothetical protein
MDKLELDARVARLERRVSLLTAMLAVAVLAAVGIGFTSLRRAEEPATATALEAAATVKDTFPPAPPAMISMATTRAPGFEGSMGWLRDQILTLHALREQELITEDEWQAKKAQLLAAPIAVAELRSDLQQVRDLCDQRLICEEERDALRARLLGLDGSEHAGQGN